MRPPRIAAEYLLTHYDLVHARSCFNEAAANRGGIRHMRCQLHTTGNASMRPPRIAAEYRCARQATKEAPKASMRPPRIAAEYIDGAFIINVEEVLQ